MTNLRRTAIIAALVLASLVLLVGIVYGADRVTNGGEILGRVSVSGVDLGGLGREDAAARMADLEAELASTPIEVTVAGHSFSLIPSDVGYDIDTEAILDEAFEIGRDREGEWPGQFSWWVGHFGNDAEPLELPSTYDADAVAAMISEWELEGIDDPPYSGNVKMAGYFVEWEYPRDGTGIDPATAAEIIGAALEDPSRPAVELPPRALPPQLTAADIDAVVAEADRLLSGPVRLINREFGTDIEIPRHVLADSLIIRMHTTTNPPSFSFTWTGDALRDYIEPRRKAHSTEAVDARIVINDDDTVSIVPSVPSRAPDLEVLATEVSAAVDSTTRTGPLAYDESLEAEFSTADAEALGIKEMISEFTTFHSCCQPRVVNIQLIADAVDGAMVMPGETFSLNDHVGERTVAKGYVRAGAIISGYIQCCDSPINIGGGTSQFTTTMYNAIFYAGLEDVYHMPHTIYFTRYPEGIEATLGYPAPDLVFRNNTENALIIKTEHTDTSITVKMFGDNGGIQVEAERSGRFNYTQPITRYEINDELDHCLYPKKSKGKEKESGSGGWSIRVYRHITDLDGEVTTEEWAWHYDGSFKVIEYNPVEPPGGCPEDPPDP
jgi:vancomycin resistance protein YoaR